MAKDDQEILIAASGCCCVPISAAAYSSWCFMMKM